MKLRPGAAILLGWFAILAASAGVVAGALGPAALFGGAVHESEARSLLGVALYPAHALRELPHLVFLALVWLAATAPARDGRELARQTGRLALAAAIAGVALFAAAAREVGVVAAWQDLSQYRAARGLEGAGSHFRFHLLSDVALAGLFYVAGRTVRRGGAPRSATPWGLAPAAALFAAALAGWGLSDVLTPRFVGHAAREVETGALVLLLPLWALALRAPGAALAPRRALGEPGVWLAAATAAVAAGVLVRHALGVDLMAASSAPSRRPALNLAVHHFEHLVDAAFLVLACRFAAPPPAPAAADRPTAPG